MLRGKPKIIQPGEPLPAATVGIGDASAGYPTTAHPYTVEDRPPGVRFYRAKESFFHPYALMQTMRLEQEKVRLIFATEEVLIEGRGLHELYAQLAAHRVAAIIEQGERYALASDAPVCIVKFTQLAKEQAGSD